MVVVQCYRYGILTTMIWEWWAVDASSAQLGIQTWTTYTTHLQKRQLGEVVILNSPGGGVGWRGHQAMRLKLRKHGGGMLRVLTQQHPVWRVWRGNEVIGGLHTQDP